MMDVDFRFYTRTLSDYCREFEYGGKESGKREFEQFARLAQVESDYEASAVIYEGIGRYCVVVFGLHRTPRDRAEREKRFSFYVSFNSASIKEKGYALLAFSRVVNDWDGVAQFADSLIKETPATRQYVADVNITDEKTGETKTVRKTKTVLTERVSFILKRSIGLFLEGLLCGGLAIWYFMPGNSSVKSQNANTTTEATNDERNSCTGNDVAGNTVDTGSPDSDNHDGI